MQPPQNVTFNVIPLFPRLESPLSAARTDTRYQTPSLLPLMSRDDARRRNGLLVSYRVLRWRRGRADGFWRVRVVVVRELQIVWCVWRSSYEVRQCMGSDA